METTSHSHSGTSDKSQVSEPAAKASADPQAAPQVPAQEVAAPLAPAAAGRPGRKLLVAVILAAIVIGAGYSLAPMVKTAFNTISTDDAYVNGHATFVAARVGGQVSRVLVDDNMRVKRGDLLLQLDKEPFQVQVAIKQAAVTAACLIAT